jgi:hypothetical protein
VNRFYLSMPPDLKKNPNSYVYASCYKCPPGPHFSIPSSFFPPRKTRPALHVRSKQEGGAVRRCQSCLLGDIDNDHFRSLNHRRDNVSRDYVDIPYRQTNGSCPSAITTPPQDYAPTQLAAIPPQTCIQALEKDERGSGGHTGASPHLS